MKKMYSKPEIMFESFVMSTNIAAGCKMIVGTPSENSCGIVGSDGVSLFAEHCGFDWTILNGDNYNGFCYHNPSDDNRMFNS